MATARTVEPPLLKTTMAAACGGAWYWRMRGRGAAVPHGSDNMKDREPLACSSCDATTAASATASTCGKRMYAYARVRAGACACAVVLGTAAPLLLERLGIDPCNCASPALATLTDIGGVAVLCLMGSWLLG